LARKAERAREAKAEATRKVVEAREALAKKAEEKQERAAARKAATEERAQAKRDKRALRTRLTNTGDQSARARARAKKSKQRLSGKQSSAEAYGERRPHSKDAADGSKDDGSGSRGSQVLSKQ
jgi:chromosome segregation ATPase